MSRHFGYHGSPLDAHDCPICAEAQDVQGEEIAIRAAEAANSDAPERTKEEIDDLKAKWNADPCFDIEDTPGFERHFEELYCYRVETEKSNADHWHQMALLKAEEIGCPGNVQLGRYILRLEGKLERRLSNLESELDTLREEVGEMRLTLGYRV